MGWLGVLLQSKSIKASGIAIGSSGIIAMMLGVIDAKDVAIREMVTLKNKAVVSEISHIKKGQDEIKEMLIRIDERLYNINQKEK